MKKLCLLTFSFLFLIISWCQTPQGVSYQAIARNAGGVPIANHSLQIKFNVIDSVVSGNIVYVETHNTVTSNLGLFSLTVGAGTPSLNTFSNINWSKNSKYLKIEMDTNSTANWIMLGTQQIMSVPYSLWAANGVKPGANVGDMLYWNGTSWTNIPVGTDGQVLALKNNKPTWQFIASLPIILTPSVNSIGYTTAQFEGEVYADGGALVTARGFCWDTLVNPTLSSNFSNDGAGVISYSRIVSGLKPNKTYYLKAYATNIAGTVYSPQVSFTTLSNTLTLPINGELFIVGSATAAGWGNPPVPVPGTKFTKVSATKYEITLPLSASGEFLLLPITGSWSYTYRDISPTTVPNSTSYQGAFQYSTVGGYNFKGPTASGNYKITADFSTGIYTVVKVADTLTISFSRDTITNDGFDTTAIMVRDISGNDVTSSSSIYINGSLVTSSTFIASSLANATVYATRSGLTSATRTIFVKAADVSPFTKKILAEQPTGAWSGYDPRVINKLDNYIATKPNCIVMRIHGGSGTDPYKYQYYSNYNSAFGVFGYPFAVYNRLGQWSENTADLDNELSKPAPLGLAIQSNMSGTNITGTVSVKFNVTTSKKMKIVIALVENGLISSQANYYSTSGGVTPYLYGGVNPITNFNHRFVLRTTATDLFGDNIPTSFQVKNNTYSLSFSMSTSGVTSAGASYTAIPANCSIVAFVVDGTTDAKGVYNVQTAPVGTIKNFD